MKKRWIYCILPMITLILEILPFGAVCNFANPEGEPWRETFSYFDLLPFGYANFSPFLTAILTCVVLALTVVFCLTGRYGVVKALKAVLCAAVILSLCPLLLGVRYVSVVGILISLSLLAEGILFWVSAKNPLV